MRAERDEELVLRWFHEQHASDAGARWYARLLLKIDTLESSPHQCRFADEMDEVDFELRELLFGRQRGIYRILFEIRGRVVYILRIRHSARDTLSAEEL